MTDDELVARIEHWRISNQMERGVTFIKRLEEIVDGLGIMGANDMDGLSRTQTLLFHHATQMLADLLENLTEPYTGADHA